MAATGVHTYPYTSFNFLVELDGIAQASFTECSGLESTTEVIDTREGGNRTTVYKQPGRTTYSDLTLKWGLTDSLELFTWRQQIIDGTVVRKSGSIVVFDLRNRTEVARWNFTNAWPSKWTGPSFNARGDEIAIETLVLVHEGIVRG